MFPRTWHRSWEKESQETLSFSPKNKFFLKDLGMVGSLKLRVELTGSPKHLHLSISPSILHLLPVVEQWCSCSLGFVIMTEVSYIILLHSVVPAVTRDKTKDKQIKLSEQNTRAIQSIKNQQNLLSLWLQMIARSEVSNFVESHFQWKQLHALFLGTAYNW